MGGSEEEEEAIRTSSACYVLFDGLEGGQYICVCQFKVKHDRTHH